MSLRERESISCCAGDGIGFAWASLLPGDDDLSGAPLLRTGRLPTCNGPRTSAVPQPSGKRGVTTLARRPGNSAMPTQRPCSGQIPGAIWNGPPGRHLPDAPEMLPACAGVAVDGHLAPTGGGVQLSCGATIRRSAISTGRP